MGLADELRKGEQMPLEGGSTANPESAAFEVAAPAIEGIQEKNIEKVPFSVSSELPVMESESQAAEAITETKSAEEVFADQIAEILLQKNENGESLLDFVKPELKADFDYNFKKFIIENFYHEQKDKKMDQEKLGKLLLKFYLVYLQDVNEFFAAQEAFRDSNRLLKFFKEKNI